MGRTKQGGTVTSIDTPQRFTLSHSQIQVLKWTIYSLISANFVYYLVYDFSASLHVLTESSTFLNWFQTFATSLAVFAWITLILLYEVETYWLDFDFDNKWVLRGIQALKLVCYALILQTTYAYINEWVQVSNVVRLDQIQDLCGLAGLDYSFLRGLDYTYIDAESCRTIATSGDLFAYPESTNARIAMDASSLEGARTLALLDVIENLTWWVVIICLEATVRLQDRGYHDGPSITWLNRIKWTSYGVLGSIAIIWISDGYYVFAWDEFLWIAGFSALDLNLSEWRDELEEKEEAGELEVG